MNEVDMAGREKDMGKTSVLLADKHNIVTEGIRNLLEPEFSVIGTVRNGLDMVEEATKLHPDVIVAEVDLSELTGIEAMSRIHECGCKSHVVFLTSYSNPSYAVEAFDAGASGYLVKDLSGDELRKAIREAVRGRKYASPPIIGDLNRNYSWEGQSRHAVCPELTTRQLEVLQHLTDGLSVPKIAEVMKISSRTVEYHKYEMMKKLAVDSTTALILHGMKTGIVASK